MSVVKGAFAESLAIDYLLNQGFSVIQHNFRTRRGEIDIIAWDQKVLCFIEVKARRQSYFGSPFESITPSKIKRIVGAAREFMASWPTAWPLLRFDALAIDLGPTPPQFTLLKAAFEA